MMASVLSGIAAAGGGFADPVMDGQSVFRTAMMALAEPGIIRPIEATALAALQPPAPLLPASAAFLLALADFETPVWLDAMLDTPEVTDYLRFHAGCPLVAERSAATFAVIADAAALTGFESFALGSLDYPDRSTTVVVQVDNLCAEPGWRLAGPGIQDSRLIGLRPDAAGLLAALAANRALFPRGIDLVFTDGASLLGLPRSTIVTEA